MNIEKYMRIDHVCRYLNKSQSTLYRWRIQGTGPQYYQIGGMVYYLKNDIDDWLNKTVTKSWF